MIVRPACDHFPDSTMLGPAMPWNETQADLVFGDRRPLSIRTGGTPTGRLDVLLYAAEESDLHLFVNPLEGGRWEIGGQIKDRGAHPVAARLRSSTEGPTGELGRLAFRENSCEVALTHGTTSAVTAANLPLLPDPKRERVELPGEPRPDAEFSIGFSLERPEERLGRAIFPASTGGPPLWLTFDRV